MAGDHKTWRTGFENGECSSARFNCPIALCITGTSSGGGGEEKVLLCCDESNYSVRRIALSVGLFEPVRRVSTFFGATPTCRAGPINTPGVGALKGPRAICADPIRPGAFFIADEHSIRYCDRNKTSTSSTGKSQTSVAVQQHVIGGMDQRFSYLSGVLCTGDGSKLFATDTGSHQLISLDLDPTSRNVPVPVLHHPKAWSFASSLPYQLCFDRSTRNAQDSVLFIAASEGIRRFDIKTGISTGCVCLNAFTRIHQPNLWVVGCCLLPVPVSGIG